MNFIHLIIQPVCIDHCFKHEETEAQRVTRLAYGVTQPIGGGAEIQTQGRLLWLSHTGRAVSMTEGRGANPGHLVKRQDPPSAASEDRIVESKPGWQRFHTVASTYAPKYYNAFRKTVISNYFKITEY